MQYLVIGMDGKDEDALKRRYAVREAHLALGDELVKSGNLMYGAGILDDDGNLVGSMYLVEFPTKEAFDVWYKKEPYVTGNVWQDIIIHKSVTGKPWQYNRPKEWFEKR